MRRLRIAIAVLFLIGSSVVFVFAGITLQLGKVGSPVGAVAVPSAQIVAPTGTRWIIPGRPIDIVRRPSDGAIYVKTTDAILRLDPSSGEVLEKVSVKGGASLHGLALTPDGQRLLSSDAQSTVHVFDVSRAIKEEKGIVFPNPAIGGVPYPCGIAVSADGATAYVCLSRSNQLATVDLKSLAITSQVGVAPAPFDVAVSGNTAVVSCWGRRPGASSKSAPSSGTDVEIDDRGIATGGTIDFVNLASGIGSTVITDHQPSQVLISSAGTAYIPCPSDDTLTKWDVKAGKLLGTLHLRPGHSGLLGVAPNALAFNADETKLYVACGSINAVAVVDLANSGMQVNGYVAADWYPIGVVASADRLWAINGKGIGSRADAGTKHSVYSFTGTVSKYNLPLKDLADQTKVALEQATAFANDAPVPKTSPLYNSPIKHIFYIIKENRTYDQVLGDMPQGDGDPSLLNFGEKITPNTHRLARQFVLLDNFYCNGVNSADGHSWATEGNASSYFERSFGGFTRSYPFVVDDPLIPNPSGFIWNDALRHGKTFWNYGESDYAGTTQNFAKNLADLKAGKLTPFTQNIPVSDLKTHSQPDFPGWNLEIPDQVRAARFIADFRKREAAGTVPNLSIIYLPEDHTGASVSPATCVADNDYGVGLVVEAISHSKVWESSAIFVVEDDAQAGYDHVDGHRSPCLVISPYTVHGKTVSAFYSQASVLHTMELILGLPAMNRLDSIAPVMREVFEGPYDASPYSAVAPNVAVAKEPEFMRRAALNVSKPDMVNPQLMNRLVWRAMRPGEPYPVAFEGSHGKGLAKRGLVLESKGVQRGDDD